MIDTPFGATNTEVTTRGLVVGLALLLTPALSLAQMTTVRVDGLGEFAHEEAEQVDYDYLSGGTVGMVFGEGSWPSTRSILLREVDSAGGERLETVTSFVGNVFDAELVYDSAGSPHVLVDFMAYEDGYLREVWEYVRSPEGWTAVLAFRSDDYNAALAAAALGPGDAIHAVMRNGFDARLHYATSAGGVWHWEELPHESTARRAATVDLAVDPDGAAHIVYGVENTASSPADRLELRYVSNSTGPWQREVVWPQGNTSWSLHVDPSIALGSDGAVAIASTFGVTASSGSLIYSHLRLTRLGLGGWTSEVVAGSSDGFVGSDGSQFTGWSPQLLVDGDGLVHVFFSDMACWHVQNGQQCQQGQIRHAGGSGGSWSLTTLYRQVVNSGSQLQRMSLQSAGEASNAGLLSVLAYEGSPENTEWTGSWTQLRLLASDSVIFSNGFESGDSSMWSQ